MDEPKDLSESRLRKIVEQCLRRALPKGAPLPPEDEDWIDSGALDSMGRVDVLLCIERATGLTDFFDRMEGEPPNSTRSVMAVLQRAVSGREQVRQREAISVPGDRVGEAYMAGWGFALGSQRVDAATVEQEFALAAGTIRERAGIDSVARASGEETEVSLAKSASVTALRQAGVDAGELDWIVACSETFLGFPSLACSLHSSLLGRDTCGVLDVGGACVGLLNSLSVAKSLLAAGMASQVLIATADIHSRHLAPGRVVGEFGGLFGDGASAFVVSRLAGPDRTPLYRLGEFQFGCAGTFSSALRVGMTADGVIALTFEGESLARAAVGRLERIIQDLELRSGSGREDASSFAIHQPNHRLVEIFGRQANVPVEKIPLVSKKYGNLGSSTCAVALSMALAEHGGRPANQRGPIFVAAVGPGMLWGGAVVY